MHGIWGKMMEPGNVSPSGRQGLSARGFPMPDHLLACNLAKDSRPALAAAVVAVRVAVRVHLWLPWRWVLLP